MQIGPELKDEIIKYCYQQIAPHSFEELLSYDIIPSLLYEFLFAYCKNKFLNTGRFVLDDVEEHKMIVGMVKSEQKSYVDFFKDILKVKEINSELGIIKLEKNEKQ